MQMIDLPYLQVPTTIDKFGGVLPKLPNIARRLYYMPRMKSIPVLSLSEVQAKPVDSTLSL